MLGYLVCVLLMSGRTGEEAMRGGRLGLPGCLTCVVKSLVLLEEVNVGLGGDASQPLIWGILRLFYQGQCGSCWVLARGVFHLHVSDFSRMSSSALFFAYT